MEMFSFRPKITIWSKELQGVLALCKFHYCDFSKNSINLPYYLGEGAYNEYWDENGYEYDYEAAATEGWYQDKDGEWRQDPAYAQVGRQLVFWSEFL